MIAILHEHLFRSIRLLGPSLKYKDLKSEFKE